VRTFIHSLTPVAEDRSAHRYTFCFVARDRSDDYELYLYSGWSQKRGSLAVAIRLASAAEVALYSPPEVTLERDRWIADEIHRYEYRPHLEDPNWLAGYAAKKKNELLERRDDIATAWAVYHHDSGRIAALKARSPETYARASWEIRALAVAEDLDVRSVLAASRPKETRDDYRERQLQHRRSKALTSLALAAEKQKAIADLDALNLEPDEYDQRRAVLDEIYADADGEKELFNANAKPKQI
jgi:hypothetical protein